MHPIPCMQVLQLFSLIHSWMERLQIKYFSTYWETASIAYYLMELMTLFHLFPNYIKRHFSCISHNVPPFEEVHHLHPFSFKCFLSNDIGHSMSIISPIIFRNCIRCILFNAIEDIVTFVSQLFNEIVDIATFGSQ